MTTFVKPKRKHPRARLSPRWRLVLELKMTLVRGHEVSGKSAQPSQIRALPQYTNCSVELPLWDPQSSGGRSNVRLPLMVTKRPR